MKRLTLAIFVLSMLPATVTSFAPAPLPKPPHRGDPSLTLTWCQGKWRVMSFEVYGDDGEKKATWYVQTIQIEGDNWKPYPFYPDRAMQFTIVIDNKKRPATIDYYPGTQISEQQPYLIGLIRREGADLQLLCANTRDSVSRVTSFNNPPRGWFLWTLRRE